MEKQWNGGGTLKTPFSESDYNEIFKVSTKNNEIIVSRENNVLEFKETFSFANLQQKCLKTIAGYANNEGGYIVFGIKDVPHILLGMDSKSEQQFDDFDAVKLTEQLNNHFSPEIKWQLQKYIFNGKPYGVMYVYPADDKPVMCTKTEGNLIRESAIYYRYRGQTREIKYSELKKIIEGRIMKNDFMWQDTFRKISKIGIDNIALINTVSGHVSGQSGQFLMDKQLIDQLKFIKEGEFRETEGAPTLKLVGELVQLDGGKVPIVTNTKIVAKRGVRVTDIIIDFLDLKDIAYPMDYIAQMCYELSSLMPIYYYMSKVEDKAQIIPAIEGLKTRGQTKQRILKRIKSEESFFKRGTACYSKSNEIKREFCKAILDERDVGELDYSEIRYFFQAICTLPAETVNEHYSFISDKIKYYFTKVYLDRGFKYMDDVRRAICYLDEVAFKNKAVIQ